MADMIKAMCKEHVDQVVEIHLKSFTGFFLSSLGKKFLSLYYRGICAAEEGIKFVYFEDNGNPVGFVVGASNPRGFYSRLLKKDWYKFALASIIPICKNPKIFFRIVRAVMYPKTNPVGDNIAGIFSMAVLPDRQGAGAGKQLVQAFFTEVKNRGCKKVFLTTDRDNNDSVNKFHTSMGFVLKYSYTTPEGRSMNEYWIDLF